ncbi:hypothetical protein B1H10_02950 [candidate division KSB1 bacterium 4484_188]|nr:MAG: hypothetical protein B1H10_02950 [candidate division KSB1 bacterium 4484_188]
MGISLIAGLGNPGLQDESAGLNAVKRILKQYPQNSLRYLLLGDSILHFPPLYRNEQKIVFISSGYLGKYFGEHILCSLREIDKEHKIIGISDADIDTLVREIPEIKSARVMLWAFQIHWNEWGDELSPEVSRAVKHLVHNFWHILEELNFVA